MMTSKSNKIITAGGMISIKNIKENKVNKVKVKLISKILNKIIKK